MIGQTVHPRGACDLQVCTSNPDVSMARLTQIEKKLSARHANVAVSLQGVLAEAEQLWERQGISSVEVSWVRCSASEISADGATCTQPLLLYKFFSAWTLGRCRPFYWSLYRSLVDM